MYAPNAKAQYQPFLNEVSVALQKVTCAKSIVILSDFNAHGGTENKTWKGVIKRQEDFDIIETKGVCHTSVPPTNCAK